MGRLQKLSRQVSEQGIGALPGWAANWAYWNAGLYRFPIAQKTRKELRYRQPNKKYNIMAPILIHQMGKVGSSSVYETLVALDLDVPVYHSHVLNKFDEYEQSVKQTRADPAKNIEFLRASRSLRQILDSNRWESWSVITLVRAPIPRAISDFFENIETYIPDFGARRARGDIRLQEVQEVFWTRYKDYAQIHWLDDQVRDVFGIDVMATPFPQEKGYAIYTHKNFRLLLLRLEDLNRCAPSAFGEFFGLPRFKLLTSNAGEQKEYAALYREFVTQLKLPAAYVNEMHSSPYARHFYTPEELTRSVARWT